jgi:hypothetical protein
MIEFIKIQRKLVDTLLKIPDMNTTIGRNSLLQGLPDAPLQRSETSARVDLNSIVSGLERLGRLSNAGGTRPVIVVVETALESVPPTSEVAEQLNDVRKELESYYGGDTQPVLPPPSAAQIEQLIFGMQRDTRLPFSFVEGALVAGRSVARLSVPRIFDGQPEESGMYGTGWLLAPGILLTNHHVVDARDRRPKPVGLGENPAAPADFQAQAERVTAWFDYRREDNRDYVECRQAVLLAADEKLDYAVLELAEAEKVSDRQPLKVIAKRPQFQRGARLNILQHSGGGPLRYAVRNNFYVSPGESAAFIRYQTDTEPGASGSPVCDDQWQVVALHHASVDVPPQLVPQEVVSGSPVSVAVLNQAIDIHAILEHLPSPVRDRITNDKRTAP